LTAPAEESQLGPILVTGANGFIGSHVVEFFAQSGESVVALTRRPNPSRNARITNATIRDLEDRPGLRTALSGIKTVIHLAGRVHAKKEGLEDPESECKRINVGGTSALLDESIAAGVSRFLFISSVKAVASESTEILDDETTPMPTDAYGASKLEAERLVRVAAVQQGLHAPIIRLPLVYGPGMKSNMARLFQAVKRGVPLPLASIQNRRSLVYIDNAIEGMRAVLSTPQAAHEAFFISDGADVSTPELVGKIARAFGRPPRMFPAPVRAMRGVAYLLSRIPPFHLTLDSLSALVGSLFVDISKIQKMTGYTPAVSVDEGLARSTRHQ
jgi:nucleoside-diphosphate-sugar epimerase